MAIRESFCNYDAQRALDLGQIDAVIDEVTKHAENGEHFINAHPEAILRLLENIK